jgi:hypothetical protein
MNRLWIPTAMRIAPRLDEDVPPQPVTQRAGLVLIGDAAASNDPSFGCGLSLTVSTRLRTPGTGKILCIVQRNSSRDFHMSWLSLRCAMSSPETVYLTT